MGIVTNTLNDMNFRNGDKKKKKVYLVMTSCMLQHKIINMTIVYGYDRVTLVFN